MFSYCYDREIFKILRLNGYRKKNSTKGYHSSRCLHHTFDAGSVSLACCTSSLTILTTYFIIVGWTTIDFSVVVIHVDISEIACISEAIKLLVLSYYKVLHKAVFMLLVKLVSVILSNREKLNISEEIYYYWGKLLFHFYIAIIS